MTSQQFIDAVQGMSGLEELVSEHLVALADKLTDDERIAAITKLTDANAVIESAIADQIKLYKDGEQHIQHEMQAIAKVEEQGERVEEEANAASLLTTL